MSIIDVKYEYFKNQNLDINEHLPTLKRYSSICESVVEMGVRSIISTWGLLAGRPKKMISIDIKHPSFYGANINEVYEAAEIENIHFQFIEGSTLNLSIDETDLLFIDTLHTYDQLSQELKIHSDKAKKYIILHDTVSCQSELYPAINEFLGSNNNWIKHEEFFNNNGLMILMRRG